MKAKLPGQGASYSVAYKKKLAAGKKYRQENPEKFRESVKRSKAEHKEAVRIRNKAYREANKEKILEARKKYYWKNREKELARTAGYAAEAKQNRLLTGGSRMPPESYKNGSGFVIKETQDDCILPRGL